MFLQFWPIYGFDIAIALLLSVGSSITLLCLFAKKQGRAERVVATALGILCTLCVLTLGYASFIEPYRLVVTEHTIEQVLPEPLRVGVISDIHTYPGKSTAFVAKVVQRLNAQNPDIILLVGDYIFTPETPFTALAELQNLRAPLGVFAVLGNHDQGGYKTFLGNRYSKEAPVEDIVRMLKEANINIVRNGSVTVQHNLLRVHVAGIDDLWSNTHDIKATHELFDGDADVKILLSHNPSIIESDQAKDYDVVISGHTHGGQVRLPFIGPVARLPTTLGQAYDKGVFTVDNDTKLVLTSGVGESGARVRLLNPPEVVVVTVK